MICYDDMIDYLELNKNKPSIKISSPLINKYNQDNKTTCYE